MLSRKKVMLSSTNKVLTTIKETTKANMKLKTMVKKRVHSQKSHPWLSITLRAHQNFLSTNKLFKTEMLTIKVTILLLVIVGT